MTFEEDVIGAAGENQAQLGWGEGDTMEGWRILIFKKFQYEGQGQRGQ